MKNYSSPKEALFDAGRITVIGKGRISRDNNTWLDEQLAIGAFTVSGIVVKASTGPSAKPDEVERVKTSETGVVDIGEPYRNENVSEAYANGNSIGMRAVCNNCGNSLTYCYCPVPKVYVDNGIEAPVEFRVRTHPLPKNPWS